MVEAAGSVPWFESYAKPIPIYRAPALAQGQGFANVGNETLFWFSIWGAPAKGIHVARRERDRFGIFAAICWRAKETLCDFSAAIHQRKAS